MSQKVEQLNALVHVEVNVTDRVAEHVCRLLLLHNRSNWCQLLVDTVLERGILLLAIAVFGEVRVECL